MYNNFDYDLSIILEVLTVSFFFIGDLSYLLYKLNNYR